MSFRIGERLADYEVVGMLGAGGMGAVYQVRHLISDRLEAMKVLLPDLASNPELAERFIREIRLQASLSHPNIASLHNALRADNQLLMIMEFIDGETLSDIIRRKRPEPQQALEAMIQVLAALAYAHARGVIHRDVKPSNVMISREGTVKLMDFGIARGGHDLVQFTRAGAAVGSMYYMSPEQIRGERGDHRSDLYASGVTLFETLTGVRPFAGTTASEILEAHLQGVPPRPSSLNPGIPDGLSRAVLKALEKNPASRYQTADEFRDALIALSPEVIQPGSRHAPLDLLQENRGREKTPVKLTSSLTVAIPGPPPGSHGMSRTPTQPLNFDPLGIERVRKELAQHIGPMAKVLVDRAAKRARNWQELYSALAPEIPAGKQRERFLAGCPKG